MSKIRLQQKQEEQKDLKLHQMENIILQALEEEVEVEVLKLILNL